MRNRFEQTLRETYYRIGGLPSVRKMVMSCRGSAAILMYHRVLPDCEVLRYPDPNARECVPTSAFEEQVRFVSTNCRPVSMQALHRELQHHTSAADRLPVAVTFDDGYRDNMLHALPILRKYGVPATIYVSTAFTDKSGTPWWHEAWRILQELTRLAMVWNGRTVLWELRTPRQKRQCWFDLSRRFSQLPVGKQDELLNRMREGLPGESCGRSTGLWLSWEDLQVLDRDPLVAIGAHGHNHANLTAVAESAARDDIARSKSLLDEHLQQPVTDFAYPFGEVNDTVGRLVAEAGFRTAVTTQASPVAQGDAMRLPRHFISGECSPRQLEAKLSGWSAFWLNTAVGRAFTGAHHRDTARQDAPKVLYMLPVAWRGGAEKMTIELASHMPGFDPVFILPDGELARKLSRDHEVIINDEWIVADANTGKFRTLCGFPKRLIRNTSFIFRAARRHRVDMIHACRLPSAIYCIPARILLRVPLVWTNHDILPKTFKERIRAFIAAAFSSSTVCVSKACSVHSVPRRKTRVIHCGVLPASDIPECRIESIRRFIGHSPQNIYLGMIGRMARGKGHPEFLRLFRRLLHRYPNLRFVAIGMDPSTAEPDYARKTMNYVDESAISHAVSIAGFTDEIPAWCRVLDFVVSYSTLDEAFACTMLEAMAYGAIPVGPARGGIVEFLKDGFNGFTIDPSSEDDSFRKMTSVLDSYLKDRDAFGTIRRNGFGTFMSAFTTEAMCSQYRDVYNALLSRRFSFPA